MVSNFSAEPKDFDDIERRPDKLRWREAVKNELESMKENAVFKIVSFNPDMKVITSRWVFKLKTDKFGNPTVYKARLVAKGCQQRYGVDFKETYSPVVKLVTVRVVLSVALQKNYKISQMDVKTAFLYGNLDEDVYMEIPKGMKTGRGKVIKLEKSLYGLRQSPLCWYKRLNDVLVNLGFVRSLREMCLYVRECEGKVMYLVLYVDDILLISECDIQDSVVKDQLRREFEIKVENDFDQFLGIGLRYDKEEAAMYLSQKKSIKELLEFLNMQDCNGTKTPMEKGLNLSSAVNGNKEFEVPYKEAIGKMMYIMLSCRPDVCFAISYLSRFQQNPASEHWKAVKHLARFLKCTEDTELVLKRNSNSAILEGFVDADYANDESDRKSTTGFLFKVFGNTVMWSSKKQATVSCSTTEAEYVALAQALQEGIWIKGLLEDLKIPVSQVIINEDNQSCIKMAKNPQCKRVKHIDVKFHFIREQVENKILHLNFVGTANQQADILTKALGIQQFKTFCDVLGLKHREGVL